MLEQWNSLDIWQNRMQCETTLKEYFQLRWTQSAIEYPHSKWTPPPTPPLLDPDWSMGYRRSWLEGRNFSKQISKPWSSCRKQRRWFPTPVKTMVKDLYVCVIVADLRFKSVVPSEFSMRFHIWLLDVALISEAMVDLFVPVIFF